MFRLCAHITPPGAGRNGTGVVVLGAAVQGACLPGSGWNGHARAWPAAAQPRVPVGAYRPKAGHYNLHLAGLGLRGRFGLVALWGQGDPNPVGWVFYQFDNGSNGSRVGIHGKQRTYVHCLVILCRKDSSAVVGICTDYHPAGENKETRVYFSLHLPAIHFRAFGTGDPVTALAAQPVNTLFGDDRSHNESRNGIGPPQTKDCIQ